MHHLLPFFLIVPLAGFLLSLIPSNQQEKPIFRIAAGVVLTHFALLVGVLIGWGMAGFEDLHWKGFDLYEARSAHFTIDLFFDRTTAVYFSVTVILTFMVLMFSRFYIHREKGYKRFFNNILFFYSGLTTILFAGNFETLLIGWEIIGVSSFFLIAYYRDRYLPVKNALKVVSLYRVADVFLLYAIWLCHHYFHKSITFFDLNNLMPADTPLIFGTVFEITIPMAFYVVAMVKSAQLPFSSWLPRAMEGPTSSSAIFYGSLSVHIGIFLLIRTYPLWHTSTWFLVLLAFTGIATSVVATLVARVQATVKTQIAYSSIAQIGIMVVEVALGWHTLALFHFAGNAFLRTYQLLVSPSVLSYLIHDQFFHFTPPQHQKADTFWEKLKVTVYMLSLKEWNLDTLMYRLLWMPLKMIGNSITFMTARMAVWIFVPLYVAGVVLVFQREELPQMLLRWLPTALAFISLLMIIKAFVKRNEARNAWSLVIVSQLFVGLAIAYNEQFDPAQVLLFYSGISISAAIGYRTFYILEKSGESTMLDRFQGHSYERPRLSVAFLIAGLGLIGFPITPTFIGEDLILGHVHQNQYLLAAMIGLTLILDGLAVYRIYARLFLGPHEKTYHEIAYRSS